MPWWVPPTAFAAAYLAFPSWQQVSRRSRRDGLRRGRPGRNGLCAQRMSPREAAGLVIRRVSRAPQPTIVITSNGEDSHGGTV